MTGVSFRFVHNCGFVGGNVRGRGVGDGASAYAHAETGMSADTPSYVAVLLLFVLSAVGEIAAGIPFGRIGVDGGILVDFGDVVGLK